MQNMIEEVDQLTKERAELTSQVSTCDGTHKNIGQYLYEILRAHFPEHDPPEGAPDLGYRGKHPAQGPAADSPTRVCSDAAVDHSSNDEPTEGSSLK